MKKSNQFLFLLSVLFATVGLSALQSAWALELDWSGQFRSEFDYVKTYTLNGSSAENGVDTNRQTAGGYYIVPGGSDSAQFESLFLKLQPKLIVNDNISIKSEWWVGDPVYGFYGAGEPYSSDERYFNSTYNRGSTITAQRYWAEILTDFGTLKLGRAPLNYGLGLVWNAGDDMWAHYESTGDIVQLVSKFGAFSFIPTVVSYDMGNNVGGNCAYVSSSGTCSPTQGSGGMQDYSLQLKYENLDEDFDIGVNFIRRIAGASQDPNAGYVWNSPFSSTYSASTATAVGGLNYNTYDIYFKKKLGKLDLGAEVPIVSGTVGGVPYSTWAFAGEANWRVNDPWEFDLKLGHAPGQPSYTSTNATPTNPPSTPGSFKSFYFNPDYQIALIMFNFQFANFQGPNNQNNSNVPTNKLVSPYDNPITDANYITIRPVLHADKWKFHGNFVFASAPDTSQSGQAFWNNWLRTSVQDQTGQNQSSWLGWEMDWGADFQYDQYFVFGAEIGWWFPGQFYSYSNVAGDSNPTNTVMAAALRIGVSF